MTAGPETAEAETADTRSRDLDAVAARLAGLVEDVTDPVALMATMACELKSVPGFDWVGFYRITDAGTLTIGPYQGGHGCLEIPFSRGVCGAAARDRRTVIVADVHAFPGHIACPATTRSEIALPVFDADGALIAVLDIDSDAPGAFDAGDAAALEGMLEATFAREEIPDLPERLPPRDLRRLIFEDDVFYGPVLLFLHLAIALALWPVEALIAAPGASVAELAACTVSAVTMMVPVFLIVRAYFRGKVSPLPTVMYMLCHAGLMIVGYAGIYGMLEYGPGGGLSEGANRMTACVPGGLTDFYFSAITFSTVGYGDCVPYGPARVFAMLQGLLSYFFVGITLGLMTGIAPAERKPD